MTKEELLEYKVSVLQQKVDAYEKLAALRGADITLNQLIQKEDEATAPKKDEPQKVNGHAPKKPAPTTA